MAETEALAAVQQFATQGLFATALNTLDKLPLMRSRTAAADTVRVFLLERTGRYTEAEALATKLLRGRSLTRSQRSACDLSIGMARWEQGATDEAVERFTQAVRNAKADEDLERTCWAQLRLLVSTAGMANATTVGRMLADVRLNVVRLGDPAVRAALHIFVGEIEAKRGLIAISRRHTELGVSLLQKSPNVWLESVAENNFAALAIMRFDLEAALQHSDRALTLATESGAAAVARAALSNLGLTHHLRGDFASARELLDRAYNLLPSTGEYANGILDSLARTYLAEDRLEEADSLLTRIEASVGTRSNRLLYPNRHALLTRVEWLIKVGSWVTARDLSEELRRIVDEVEDRGLKPITLARHAEVIAATSTSFDAIPTLSALSALLLGERSPHHVAEYEQALANVLARGEGHVLSAGHQGRARRIYAALRGPHSVTTDNHVAQQNGGSTSELNAAQTTQDLSSLLLHAGRPELVATGIMAVIENADCARGARAISRAADNSEDVLSAFGEVDGVDVRTFPVGTVRERTVEVHVQARPDVESHATVNSIGVIIGIARELDRARLEREERLTLWPVDELPAEDDDSVVAGTMREVMLAARKIAETRVAVLITGESGTGKEVVARAVHRYSPRARKPFVPFNCTAVPRDLIESHLFGYRKGAFTGADRDTPGLIRAAKDGTLFLDEIGDLSLDLQPKLLRFLESSEIHPLGDAMPFPVNVRIVAATNANLQKLVEQGRFREDLYYRLNVFPIELPPLRERRQEIAPLAQHFALKSSHELGKGCIRVPPDVMAHLELYSWPGNIRQLSHEINRMIALAEPNQELTVDFLPRAMREEVEKAKRRASGLEMTVSLTDQLEPTIAAVERAMITQALKQHQGKVDAAARALGISRKGLYLKRQRLGL